MDFGGSAPSPHQEPLLPHRVALVILIRDYATLNAEKEALWQKDLRGKRLLDRALLGWISLPEVPCGEMLKIVEESSALLHKKFVKSMTEVSEIMNELDLEGFLESLMKFIFCGSGPAAIPKRGQLGLFCRRTLLIYKRMGFGELYSLLTKLKKYCEQPLHTSSTCLEQQQLQTEELSGKTMNKSAMSMSFVSRGGEEDMELESHSELDSKSSRDSIETELKRTDLKTNRELISEFRYDDMEFGEHMTRTEADIFFLKQSALIEACEPTAVRPAALQKKIRDLLDNNPDLTLGHFVSYLNNLRISEYSGALDSLLLYFLRHDKVMRPEDKCDKYFGDNNWIERFSTLNLGIMHMNFDHKEEALSAVKMATSHAQLTCDWDCLTHAASYLHYLQPDKQHHRLLEEIIEPAIRNHDNGLADDVVHSFLSRRSVKGCKPKLIFDCMFATDAAFSGSQHMNVHHWVKTRFTNKACMWSLYGKRCMANLYCQLALFSQPNVQQITKKNRSRNTWRAEEAVLSYSLLAELFDQEGNTAACNTFISYVKMRYPDNTKVSKKWKGAEARINHQQCLRLGKYQEATAWEEMMMTVDQTDAKYLRAEGLAARNENLKAKTTLFELLKDKEMKPELENRIYLLLSRIHLQNKYDDLSSSLKYTNKALKISLECSLHGLMLEAGVQLAQLMRYSNTDGLSCLRSLHYEMMTNGSALLQSKYILVVLQVRIATEKNREKLLDYVEELKKVREKSEMLQDMNLQRLVLYTLAQLLNDLSVSEGISKQLQTSLIEQRNNYVFEFKRIDVQLGSTTGQILL